jgi:AbiV
MALVGLQPLPLKEWRNHISKHVSPAGFLLRKSYQNALREALQEAPHAEREATYLRLANLDAQMDYSDEDMNFFDVILARLVSNFSLQNFFQAHSKHLDKLKQSGFYVDTDEKMNIRSTPAQTTRETAALRLQYARDLFAAIREQL